MDEKDAKTIKDFLKTVLSDPERRLLLLEQLKQLGFPVAAHTEEKTKNPK